MIERLSMVEMVAALNAGEVSAREVMLAHLGRIEAVNGRVNAFAQLREDEALAESLLPRPGVLSGIPVTVKDCFDIAGMPTICGQQRRRGAVAERDANVTARLKAAGAIVVGKTNVPELVSSYETDNDVTGVTRNPWNLGYTAGGSSGGEAAAIAACCSAGGVGSDGGGSIRVPAHFCGVVGFKPTQRRIGGGGAFPPFAGPFSVCATPGPMGRTVADVRLLFEVLEGFDPRDADAGMGAVEVEERPRIGLVRQFYEVPVDREVASGLEEAAGMLREAGFVVEEVRLEGLERTPNLWGFFFGELAGVQNRRLVAGAEAEAHWTLLENLGQGKGPELGAVADAYVERDRLRALAWEQMTKYRVLLMPVSSVLAFRTRERRWDLGGAKPTGIFAAMAATTMWNVLGFPALSVPVKVGSEERPVGAQLVGRPGEDEVVLAVGEALERVRGRFPQAGVRGE